jgi:hypothetical protein
MKELYKLPNIDGAPSTAYHPQTDGQTECINQEVKQYLHIYTNYQQDNWSDWLDIAEFALNDWIHTGTQQTPFMMMYGFNPQSTSRDSIPSNNPSIINHAENLKKTRFQAELALQKVLAIMKKYYDQNKEQATDFKTGDKFWLEGTNIITLQPIKTLDNKHYGPFTILEKIGTSNYKPIALILVMHSQCLQ